MKTQGLNRNIYKIDENNRFADTEQFRTQITVNLPPERVHQRLLKYFETRDDVRIKSSEPNSIQVRTLGYRYPWINIKVGIFGEGDRTRLGFNFDFRLVYAILTVAVVMGIAILWVTTLIRPENWGLAVGFIIGILVCAPIAFASSISKAKRKFLEDIHKSFNQLEHHQTE